jgi:hypothetical protein
LGEHGGVRKMKEKYRDEKGEQNSVMEEFLDSFR